MRGTIGQRYTQAMMKRNMSTQYSPSDNDYMDEFDVAKIEQMEVNLIPCPICSGGGIVFNGVIYWRCPKCEGTGSVERKG